MGTESGCYYATGNRNLIHRSYGNIIPEGNDANFNHHVCNLFCSNSYKIVKGSNMMRYLFFIFLGMALCIQPVMADVYDISTDVPNSTYLKYWLPNFTDSGNFSIYGFGESVMFPTMHTFGFWIYLIIWALYMFAVWVRSQDVTMPLVIGILSIGVMGTLFPRESMPILIIMFAISIAIILTKVLKDQI